jgi:hypothetical protein
MPLTWSVDPTERFVVLTIRDPYTLEQWTAAVLDLLENPVFRSTRAIVIDRRGVEAPSVGFVAPVIEFMAAHAADLARRAAVVVSNGDAAAFGMARMIALRAEFETPATKLRVFYGYADAVNWVTA